MTNMRRASTMGANNGMRLLAVLSMLVAMVWTGALPGHAQAPDNDTIEGSVPIEVPFWGEQDTSEATTDESDALLNEQCGAPATDASVWYQLTPAEDLGVEVFVDESSYTAGVIVAAESEGELHVETCGPDSVFFHANAGVTYQLMVFDDQIDGEGNGGQLVIHVEGEPIGPPPEVDLTIGPIGIFHRDGSATVTGTLTCTGDAEFIELFGLMEQRVGRFVVSGYFGLFDGEGEENGGGLPASACDGTTQTWSATVNSDGGLFRGGKATVEAGVFACGFFECAEAFVTQTIALRPR